MCEWCNKDAERRVKGESYEGDGAEYIIEYDRQGSPYIDVTAYAQCGFDAGVAEIPIDYCPWCGEKLC